MNGPQQVSAHQEEILYEAVHGCEALHLSGRLEAPHPRLALACRLMGNFGSIVRVLVRGVDHEWHHSPVRLLFLTDGQATGAPEVWVLTWIRPLKGAVRR